MIMNQGFDSKFFSSNRQALRRSLPGAKLIIITANGILQQSGDNTFPFRQDPNFWYLTGVDDPDAIIVMSGSDEYLIMTDQSDAQKVFDGSFDYQDISHQSGIQTILTEKVGWDRLKSELKKVKNVATLKASPQYIKFYGFYSNPARARVLKKIKRINPLIGLHDIRLNLSELRMVKQPFELSAIQMAIDITISSIEDVSSNLAQGKYAFGYEVEADLVQGFRRRGSRGATFSPIVATGEEACTIHSTKTDSPLLKGDILVIDVGADFSHYGSDIARTLSIGNNPSSRQKEVHEAVREAQQFAYSLLKPGVVIREYENEVTLFIGQQLKKLGVLKEVTMPLIRQHFPHMTSHFLGLDPHDAGNYSRPLTPGVVLAVEPGIYIPKEKIGIRIEDNVVITEEGIRVLSQRLSADLC
jgi:Xaa-Pro aminopeptidase